MRVLRTRRATRNRASLMDLLTRSWLTAQNFVDHDEATAIAAGTANQDSDMNPALRAYSQRTPQSPGEQTEQDRRSNAVNS
jgi:hypothetical protein